ncbi:MAG: hypothetical protein GY721_05355, partial [Deltaproteobacteria bacterium]|nr:hypothetical protein [Deltaproteobacteria bacterium]
MLILANIVKTSGIVAVCGGPKSSLSFAYDDEHEGLEREKWEKILSQTLSVLEREPVGDVSDIRVQFENYTVVAKQNEGIFLGAVVVRGNPVIKSTQRLLRKAFSQFGVPVSA